MSEVDEVDIQPRKVTSDESNFDSSGSSLSSSGMSKGTKGRGRASS